MRPFALLEGLLVLSLAVALINKPAAKVPVLRLADDGKPTPALKPATLSSEACCQLSSQDKPSVQ